MAELHILIILFLVALVSATFIPSQGEIVLFALLATGEYHPWQLVLVACAGNIIGTSINYFIGRYIHHFRHRKWFPVKYKYILKAEHIFKKHGLWTLLLAWVPFIGDPITIVAGVLRVKFWLFLPLAGVGRSLRYVFVLALYKGIF